MSRLLPSFLIYKETDQDGEQKQQGAEEDRTFQTELGLKKTEADDAEYSRQFGEKSPESEEFGRFLLRSEQSDKGPAGRLA